MADQSVKGYYCSTCSILIGSTIGQARSHKCMVGVDNIWVLNNQVYTYDPNPSLDDVETEYQDSTETESQDKAGPSGIDLNSSIASTDEAGLWPTTAKKLLLNLYPKYWSLFASRQIMTKEKMFAKIAEEMQTFGYTYNTIQVKNRWRCFEKAYKNHMKNTKATGRGYKKLEFGEELHQIFHKEPRFYPEVLTSSIQTMKNAEMVDLANKGVPMMEGTSTTSDRPINQEGTLLDNSVTDNEPPRKKNHTYKATATVLEGIRQEMKRKNDLREAKQKLDEKKTDLLEKKVKLMEEYLSKLK